MLKYDMEELLPIVATLTDKYTSKESSSIRFETARQLMEAVLYCINHIEYMDESNGNSSSEVRINKAKRIGEVQGIQAIERYLRYTEYEQSFLQSFPEEYVLKTLELYHADYEELLINVCSIVLRNVLICMWIERPISGAGFTRKEIELIYKKIHGNS